MNNDTTKDESSIALKTPIYLSIVYLCLTLVIYELCPYDWPTKKPLLFYMLNIAYIVSLFCGYQIGLRKEIRFKCINWTDDKTNILLKLISYLSIVNFFMLVIYIFRDYGFKTLDFAGLFHQMMIGIKQPGMGYHLHIERLEVLDGKDVLGGTIYTFISLFWSFLKNGIVIIAMLFFKRINLVGKIFTIAYIGLTVVYYLSIGTNIQIFNVILLVELPLILHTFRLWTQGQVGVKNVLKLVFGILIGMLCLALYFGWMMESRSSTYGYDIAEYEIGNVSIDDTKMNQEQVEAGSESENEDNKIMQKVENFWISGSSYISQGYYGMSQALTEKWTPMFGLGSSMFVVDMLSDHLYNIRQYTYQEKLEKLGWDSKVRWHSMYTWIANDVSFYGVILVMFIVGFLFGMMFRDAMLTSNPFACASIYYFIIMIIFAPCNNQVAQGNDNLCNFILLVFMWMLCGQEKTYYKEND